MKNLKRALSFALASVMVIGMMVVGAGAAFTDADKIENTDAVNTMVALGVLNGKGDGSYYDPAGTLTRAEAAKIIVYALHGGKAPVIGTKATPTYSDIKGSWAEAYIEYCSSMGIIAGWDGKFNPTGELTGSAFAKMLMVAMGYNAEVFGFTGNDWEINVNIEANKIGLYKELDSIDPALTISRDDAAQMAYNALFAGTMHKSYNHNIATGAVENGYSFRNGTTDTLFYTKFNGSEKEDVLTDFTYDSEKGKWTYTVAGVPSTHKTADDFTDLFGMNVNVLYKTVDGTTTIYGIYAKDSSVVVETKVGSLPTIGANDTKFELNDVEYELEDAANTIKVYPYGETSYTYLNALKDAKENAFALKLIDNDADNKIDCGVYVPFTATKVSFSNTKTFTTGIAIDGDTTPEYKDVETFGETFAKNDIVIATAKANTTKIKTEYVVAESITGKVTGQKSGQYQIDGTWYKTADTLVAGSETINLGDTVELAVINGYYVYADVTTATSTDLLIVTKTETGEADEITGTWTAKVAFTDGTVATVETKVVDSDTATKATLNTLYTYEVEDGVYELKAATTDNTGYKVAIDSADTYVAEDEKLANDTRIADDAVVFVVYSSAKVKVISGETLKAWNTNFGDTASGFANKVDGFDTAKVLVLVDNATALPASGDEIYGYITSTPYLGKEGDDYYVYFTAWTKNGSMDVKDKVSSNSLDTTIYAQKNIVTFTDEGDGVVDGTADVNTSTGAVVAYDGTMAKVKTVKGGLAEREITDDTVIIYIDTKEVEGVEGGAIVIANETADDTYAPNVIYVGGDDNDFTVIFVDVNNKIEGASTVNYAG